MSFFIDFLAEITGVSDQPRYNSWVQDVEKKVFRVDILLESLMGKQQDRSIQELLRQLSPLLKEINLDLVLEDFAGDTRSVTVMQEARVFLLNIWHKILLLLDKLEDSRTQALFLDTIHRISMRSEFDSIHLALSDQNRPTCSSECLSSFRKYRQLLISTHSFVTIKLAESKPLPSNNSAFFMLESIMIYSKILASNFFRLPAVGHTIIETLSRDQQVSYCLKSYEENHFQKKKQPQKQNKAKSKHTPPQKTLQKTIRTVHLPHITTTPPKTVSGDSTQSLTPPQPTQPVIVTPVVSTEGEKDANITVHNNNKITSEAELVNYLKEAAEEIIESGSGEVSIHEHITPARENLSHFNLNETEKLNQLPEDPLINPPSETPSPETTLQTTPSPDTPEVIQEQINSNETNSDLDSQNEENTLESFINRDDDDDDLSDTEIAEVVTTTTTAENKLFEIHEWSFDIISDSDFRIGYPRLFSWEQFHKTMSQFGALSDNLEVSENPGWTNWLSSKSVLLPFLVKDWVEHIKKILLTNDFIISPGKTAINIIVHEVSPLSKFHWEKVPGYPQMIKAFLQVLQQITRFTMPLMDASVIMLNCSPILINYYNRVILSRTMLFNISQVSESLLQIQTFFHQFKKINRPLPQNFDLPYFCSAFDAVINSDHHQLIQRFLQLIFDISDIFTGELRKHFFAEYLLKKYFFNLFLHWDEVSRNYFHQLLLWKFVRMKSSLVQGNLSEYPFIGKEKDNTFSYIDPEVEYNNDLLMFGKIQCYIQLIQAQTKEGTETAFFEKNLQIYVNRALAEFQFYVTRYSAWEKTEDRDWKLMPLSLLEGKRLSPFRMKFNY